MPEVLKIHIKRGNKGYGFILSNQAPCVVSNVTDAGPADIALLKNGDEILEVNGENVARSTHEHVVRLLLKSSTKTVELLVCRHSEQFHSMEQLVTEIDDKEDLHKSITETVDKVVQDLRGPLKLGVFFRDEKQSPRKKRQDFLREAAFDKGNLERVFRSSLHDPVDNFSSFCTSLEDSDIMAGNFDIVVGYLQTIELPDSKNLPLTSQNLLSNCVKGLHVKSKKVNRHFLMHISSTGISLSSSTSHKHINYALKTITYTCCCPDDEKYFGIVTKKEPLSESPSMPSPYNTKKHRKSQQLDTCSCHIFMVDPELSSHSRHHSISKLFGLACQPDPHSGCCQEFPSNSSVVLNTLQSLFSEVAPCDVDSPTPLVALSQINLDDGEAAYEHGLSRMLQIRGEKDYLGSHGKSHVEVRNFTRSPFKQRKPLPIALYDENDGNIGNQRKNGEELPLEKEFVCGTSGNTMPSIEDPCDECPTKESNPFDNSMDNSIVNGKKKSPECDTSLEILLKNPFTLQCFEEFLQKEHSEENIMFWKTVESFRTIVDPVKLRKTAIDIYHTYLAGGAPGLVNVDQKSVKKAEERLINPDAHMFDLQQQQIFMLMKYDCFPRFLKSEFNRRTPTGDDIEDECENKEKKRKTQWYLKKKAASKESGVKLKAEHETNDQYDRKKTLLSLWNKGKGPKQDSKSREKAGKLGKGKGQHGSQSSLSDNGSRPTTPNFADDRKKFELPKSPSEIKELLGSEMPFCRVILPNGSSNVIMLESGKIIREVLQTCCSRQNFVLSAYDVRVDDEKKQPVDLNKDSMFFADDVFYLERKVQFRFDLPNKRSVAVLDSSTAILFDVIEPILRKNGYNIENFNVRLNQSHEMVSLHSTVGHVENKHLTTELKATFQGNVTWKPPTAIGLPTKARVHRQGSKDDSSLPPTSKFAPKSIKNKEDIAKFSRRGSLEGHKSYFARLKHGIKGGRATRSKSIDHTKYGLKASKAKGGASSKLLTVSGPPLHERQNSAPSFTNLDDDSKIIDWGCHGDTNERFRPASEVFYSKNMDDDDDDDEHQYSRFDRRASMPSHFFGNSSQNFNPTENSSLEFSVPGPKKTLAHAHRMKEVCVNMNAAVSDPEIAIRRDRAQNLKAVSEDVRRSKSTSLAHKNSENEKKVEEKSKNRKKLQKNLESWRARENSCDSSEERESGNLRKAKREDPKRHSSSGLPKHSPGSPQNKQKKVAMEEAEIAIAHSPIYLDDAKKPNTLKARPLPITIDNESEILRGLDLESYEQIQTPDIVIDRVENEHMDDSFDSAIERLSRRKKKDEKPAEAVPSASLDLQMQGKLSDEEKQDRSCDSPSGEIVNDASSFGSPGRLGFSESEYNATVTGSVNDETLIMEDKDTGLDLSELMDISNVKKNRKAMKQKGEKESKVKETTITFV